MAQLEVAVLGGSGFLGAGICAELALLKCKVHMIDLKMESCNEGEREREEKSVRNSKYTSTRNISSPARRCALPSLAELPPQLRTLGEAWDELSAKHRTDFTLRETLRLISPPAAIQQKIMPQLQEMVRTGLISHDDMQRVKDNIHPTTNMPDAVRTAAVIVECLPERIPEHQKLKVDTLNKVAEYARPDAQIWTNTINFPVTEIAGQIRRGQSLAGVRFLYPVILIQNVEVSQGISKDALDKAKNTLKELGKLPFIKNPGREPFKLVEENVKGLQAVEATRRKDVLAGGVLYPTDGVNTARALRPLPRGMQGLSLEFELFSGATLPFGNSGWHPYVPRPKYNVAPAPPAVLAAVQPSAPPAAAPFVGSGHAASVLTGGVGNNFVAAPPAAPFTQGTGHGVSRLAAAPNNPFVTPSAQPAKAKAAVQPSAPPARAIVFDSTDHTEETDADNVCSVCMDRPKNCTFDPCGHLCICETCGKELQKTSKQCPMCRKPFIKILKVYT